MGITKTLEKRLSHLIAALSVGWEIEEPVMLGALRGNSNEGVYHFVLRNNAEDKTTMLSLPPSPELLVFLADNRIDINSLWYGWGKSSCFTSFSSPSLFSGRENQILSP